MICALSLQEYITVDCQFVRIFHKDGRRKDIIDSGGLIKELVVCNHSNQYVSLVSQHEMKVNEIIMHPLYVCSENKIMIIMIKVDILISNFVL